MAIMGAYLRSAHTSDILIEIHVAIFILRFSCPRYTRIASLVSCRVPDSATFYRY